MTLYVVKPNNNIIEKVSLHIGSLNLDKEWSIEIKPYKKSLTGQQRRYWHKLLSIISKHTGYSTEDLKIRMCYTLNYTRDVKLKDGTIITQRLSTEQLTREQYSKLIETSIMACLELDLQYPDARFYGYEL